MLCAVLSQSDYAIELCQAVSGTFAPPFSGVLCQLCEAHSSVKLQGFMSQAMLVYLEVLLIAQYTFQIPTRLRCSFVTPALRDAAEFIGLHGSAVRCLPIFVLYLATLMHTYVLARWQVRAGSEGHAPACETARYNKGTDMNPFEAVLNAGAAVEDCCNLATRMHSDIDRLSAL